jgi:hypothetical protein
MKLSSLASLLAGLGAVACGEPVRLAEGDAVRLNPEIVTPASATPLAVTLEAADDAGVTRVALLPSCAAIGAAPCAGYESRLWVDADGIWLANIGQDQRTLQLAQLAPNGEFVRAGQYTEPDRFRTVKKSALWRAYDGMLRVALVQDGCDLQQAEGSTFCAASPERVHILSVDANLEVHEQSTFALESGFRTTFLSASAQGAVLVSDMEYNRTVDGRYYHHVMVYRLEQDGTRGPVRSFHGDFSSVYAGRSGAIDDAGSIGFVLDRARNHVYSFDPAGKRSRDVTFSNLEQVLETAVPYGEQRLLAIFNSAPGNFELVELNGTASTTRALHLDVLPRSSDFAQLYLKHVRVGTLGDIELLFAREAPVGSVFCRVPRSEPTTICSDLGAQGELWDMRSTAFGTWMATGTSLIHVP